MLEKSRSRELVLKYLCNCQDNPDKSLSITEFLDIEKTRNKNTRKYAIKLAGYALENRAAIFEHMMKSAENWSVERMSTVDRCIILSAVAELLMGRTPVKVVINEAINLAKKYGPQADSPAFVNGVIDRIARTISDDSK